MSREVDLLILGHRGASADHPENTVAAFRSALEQGADGVELDVRANRHGELIVQHDAAYRDGRTVFGTPLSEAPEGTVDLAAALDACSGGLVNVEIKNSPGDLGRGVEHDLTVADAVVALLQERARAGAGDDVLVSSFDLATIDRVREIEGAPPTGFLVFDLTAQSDAPEVAAERGHVALHPWDGFVDAALVERCHALGLAVNTWTIDDPDRVAALAAIGADAAITNVPTVALRAIGRA